jgi:ATP-dependent exoDNAse (exonuclease V) alpha subunit
MGNIFDQNKFCIDSKLLITGETTVNKDNWMDFYRKEKPLEFDYGFSVTTHKFQGSQADKVLCFVEKMGDKEQYYRWLYTSVTRAVDKVVLVV